MKNFLRFIEVILIVLATVAYAAELPLVQTEIQIKALKGGKPTAGDIVELKIQPSPETISGVEPEMAEKLKEGPVEWGAGRILWWKPADPSTGTIVVGLTTYKPGMFEIPAIKFKKSGQFVFSSQSINVEYSSVGKDDKQVDIYPPEAVSFPRWVWVSLGFFALALVLGAIWLVARWSRRRKSRLEEFAKAPKVLSPIEEFEKIRSETEKKEFVAKEQYKPHYFALSEAAKRFLGRAFRFDAEERTTRELVRELENLGMSTETTNYWQTILEEMDMTKFTDQKPDPQIARGLAERLSRLVAESYRNSPVAREALLVQSQQKALPQ